MMAATPRHVIFGTGAIGLATLDALRRRGERVRLVNRSGTARRLNGQPLTETRPYAAHTKTGTLRARMARDLLAAHAAGRVQVAIGRASDYFGPRGGAQSNLGDRVIPAALAGKTATVMGDPDQPHTYTYIPDIGEGLAVLGEHPDAPGEVWHLPNDPHTRTTASWSTASTASPASPAPSSAAPQCWCCEPSGSSTPPSGNWWSCSMSSRSPSSSTAPRSRPSSRSTPPDWTRP
jgi:nucleoside-diphosphate-sugar epimerase